MRVNHQWYCDVTRQFRWHSLIRFNADWQVYRALEGLLRRAERRSRLVDKKESSAVDLEPDEVDHEAPDGLVHHE